MRIKRPGSDDWYRGAKRIKTSFITLRQEPAFDRALSSLRQKYFPNFKQYQRLQSNQEKALARLTCLPRRRLGVLSFDELFTTIIPQAIAFRLAQHPLRKSPLSPCAEIGFLSAEIVKELPLVYRRPVEEIIELDVRAARYKREVRLPKGALVRFSKQFLIRFEDAENIFFHDLPCVLTCPRKKLVGKTPVRWWLRKRWTKAAERTERRKLFVLNLKQKHPSLTTDQIAGRCCLEGGFDISQGGVKKILSRIKKKTRN